MSGKTLWALRQDDPHDHEQENENENENTLRQDPATLQEAKQFLRYMIEHTVGVMKTREIAW